jgi:hypothetical protein
VDSPLQILQTLSNSNIHHLDGKPWQVLCYVKAKYQLFADKELQTTVNNCDYSDNEPQLAVMTVLVRISICCQSSVLLLNYMNLRKHSGGSKNYPQCICISVGSTVVLCSIAMCGFHLIISAQV